MKIGSVIAGAVVIIIAIAMGISGCVSGNVSPGGHSAAVDTSIDVGVQVLDLVNNTQVIGAPVYFAACCPDGTDARDVHLNATTADDGWAYFQVNYTLNKGEAVYMAASCVGPLLEADFAAGAFNGSGYLGEWKSVDYEFLYNPESDETAFVGYAIIVDRDSGRMI